MASLLPPTHLPAAVFAGNLSLKPRAVALGEQPAYQGPVHCITTIVRTEGLAGLYRGASAMLLRDVPGYCLYFIPYVLLSEWIDPTDTKSLERENQEDEQKKNQRQK